MPKQSQALIDLMIKFKLLEQRIIIYEASKPETKLSWKSCVITQNLHGGDEGNKHYEDFPTIKEAAKEFALPEISEIGIWYDSFVNGVSVFYGDGSSYERKGDF